MEAHAVFVFLQHTPNVYVHRCTFSPACAQSLHWVRRACIQSVSFRSAPNDLGSVIHCDVFSTHVWNHTLDQVTSLTAAGDWATRDSSEDSGVAPGYSRLNS